MHQLLFSPPKGQRDVDFQGKREPQSKFIDFIEDKRKTMHENVGPQFSS